jgi:hypothetical protein
MCQSPPPLPSPGNAQLSLAPLYFYSPFIHRMSLLLKQQTSITDYRLPDQGKQTSVFRFRLQRTSGSLPFPFFRLQQTYGNCRFLLVPFFAVVCLCRLYLYLYLYSAVSNGKRKPRRFSLIRLTSAHRANGSYPFANGLNGLAHLCLYLSVPKITGQYFSSPGKRACFLYDKTTVVNNEIA